jgi:hypothetical protein
LELEHGLSLAAGAARDVGRAVTSVQPGHEYGRLRVEIVVVSAISIPGRWNMYVALSLKRLLVAAAALVCLSATSAGTADTVSAWGESGLAPESGQWCGLTDEGGTLTFEVTGDKRYVQGFHFWIPGCSLSVGEVSLNARAQIKSAKFTLRGASEDADEDERRTMRRQPPAPGGPGRCLVVPCRPHSSAPPRAPQPSGDENPLLVRGAFEAVDSVSGTFRVPKDGHGCGGLIEVGYYTAWPARYGCP